MAGGLSGGEHVVDPSDPAYSNNAACVGGGTFSYGAMAWRYMEKDFRMRSTYGAVAGSTLEDWPIGYGDLEPYYEKAEWEIGVSGDDSNNIFKAPRGKPLPMPPLSPNKEYQVLRSGCAAAGPASVRYSHAAQYGALQRPRIVHALPLVRGIRLRSRMRPAGTHNTVIPAALATGNCELRTAA